MDFWRFLDDLDEERLAATVMENTMASLSARFFREAAYRWPPRVPERDKIRLRRHFLTSVFSECCFPLIWFLMFCHSWDSFGDDVGFGAAFQRCRSGRSFLHACSDGLQLLDGEDMRKGECHGYSLLSRGSFQDALDAGVERSIWCMSLAHTVGPNEL